MLDNDYSELLKSADAIRQAFLDDLYFAYFYTFNIMRNKPPMIPRPKNRKNHFRVMSTYIMYALRADRVNLPDLVLTLNTIPRYGKTELMCIAIAWCYAQNPAANFIYGSYKKMLATQQTEYVRKILQSRFYQAFFDVRLSKSSTAKDNFLTVQGGRTIAVGADGSSLGI